MVALLLDLLIRDLHQNRLSLNDVMVQMWQKFGMQEIGYTTQDLKRVIEQIAQIDLSDFFKQYIDGLDHLPFLKYLEPFGLTLVEHSESSPYLGIRVEPENGQETIKFVEAHSPASTAGLDVGDELLAIDGIKVGINQLGHRLQDYQPKDTIEITVFHQDELRNYKVTLGKPRPQKYQLRPAGNPSTSQKDNFEGWLGVPITTIQ
jgi:predicted metalloprotease with PDZ domain